jgi:hypothetical protein
MIKKETSHSRKHHARFQNYDTINVDGVERGDLVSFAFVAGAAYLKSSFGDIEKFPVGEFSVTRSTSGWGLRITSRS